MVVAFTRALRVAARGATTPLLRRGLCPLGSVGTAACGSDGYGSGPSHWAGLCAAAAAAGAAALIVVKEEERRRPRAAARCEAVTRVCLGDIAKLQECSTSEVALGPEGSKVAGKVLLHRHLGGFYATSLTGLDAYPVEVDKGIAYATLPADLVTGRRRADQFRRDSRVRRTFALIGGGPASLAAAETLRKEGFKGRIVMLTQESHLPYDRIVLSKNLDKSADALLLRPPSFYAAWDIEVLREAQVTRLDCTARKISYRVPGNTGVDTVLDYDSVLVASGSKARTLSDTPGAALQGVCTLRTAEDAAAITRRAKKGQKMVVVGGSFLGMEVASSLKKKHCDVAVIAPETVPYERSFGTQVGSAFVRLLQTHNIEWLGNAQVHVFRGTDRVNGVELEDGEVLAADMVVIAAGALPNTGFIEGAPLGQDGSITVTPLLQSESVPTLFAAGDVCSYPSPQSGGTMKRIEHWDSAVEQGRVAARSMLGKGQPFAATPFFSSGLFGKSLRFVGHAPADLDYVIVEGDVSTMEFIAYYTQEKDIVAVATVNKDSVAVDCAELMRLGNMPKVADLMYGTFNAENLRERVEYFAGQAK